MICFHHNDADGYCAAAVVHLSQGKDSLDRYVEMDYKKPVDVEAIYPNEVVIIVDFSFKPEVMAKVIERTQNIIWIDHHKTAEAYDYGWTLSGLRDFTEPGKSGAMLAWEYFFKNKPAPLAVQLVSDFDTWQHKMVDDVKFVLGLMSNKWVTDPTSLEWEHLLVPEHAAYVNDCIRDGHAIEKFRDQKCEGYCRMYGYETEIAGLGSTDKHQAFAVNLYTLGSHTFGERMQKYDVCIAYVFDGKSFTVSLYSDRGIDTSVISKSFGGGGHSAASGFQCERLPFHPKGEREHE